MVFIAFILCTICFIGDIIILHKVTKEKEKIEKLKESLKGDNKNEKV